MWSLKADVKDVLTGPTVSVAFDVFGYTRGRLPRDPDGEPTRMSLKDWAGLDRGTSFNVMTIFVGIESFTPSMFDEIDTAVHRIREIYGVIDLGVKWIVHWSITMGDADGLDVLTSEGEVDDLLSGWGFDKNAINLYFPAGWMMADGLLGKSALPGPCPGEQSQTKGNAGSCVGLTGASLSSRTCSHEIGHYLGLTHKQNFSGNLMCQTKYASIPTWKAVTLEAVDGDDQPAEVKRHCMVTRWWVT
jgi:hypothetical protein